ncbi:MAG: heme exporter protein CcmD [Zoogloeaceae bacterium]|jgi:heme exporter protein D|nr:heme exporter protein CcmD [Zoogloeaceae bacterium]
MNWGSSAEFFAMGGHALYVWGSFGVCAALMAIEPLLARARRKKALIELKREIAARKENETET